MQQHYSNMFEGIHEDGRLDTVYLDFAKAYNSQPAYLIKRVLIQKIKGNSEKMVKNFLRNKKYCLVANGVISDKHNVTLGVPQGLVLAF